MPSQPRDLVFISYSHEDAIWLERLQKFLKPYVRQGQLEIWADPRIRVGDRWESEITDKLNRAAVGVLLVSQDLITSDFIADVELPALIDAASRGLLTLFCIPISASTYRATDLQRFQWAGSPSEPLDQLDSPQRNRVLVEVTEKIVEAAQERLKRSVPSEPPAKRGGRAPVQPVAPSPSDKPGDLHGVPPLPPHYLPRPADLERLRHSLLASGEGAVGITGSAYRVGLHGQGGIGKSVLAAALVSDEEVRRAFPDGVYWISLGQTPDLLRLQTWLGEAICGRPVAVTSVQEGERVLSECLDSPSCLLVLDDVWDIGHALAFDVVGPRSRLLVTTRDVEILTALGATDVSIERLSEELALELLATWAGEDRGSLPHAAVAVAYECGYLPLALSLAGARVRGGLAWADLHHALERGRLEFLDHPYGSVFRSMRLSLDALQPDHQELYLELAVFPEDVRVPESAVLKLWHRTAGLDAVASRDLLAKFGSKALLERTRVSDGWEITFHDLQHDFLRILADDLAALNCALLDAFAVELPARSEGGVAWYAMPKDESYLWIHLGEHLIAGERSEELAVLLFDYRWLEAKLWAAGLTALLADVELFSSDSDFALLARTLRMSAHVLATNPDQLPSQLIGRLLGLDHPRLQAMLRGIQPLRRSTWLRPLTGSLIAPTGGLLRTLEGHSDWVGTVAITADGRLAVSGSDDKTLKVWDLESGRELRTLKGHSDVVNSVAVTVSGRLAVSASDDRTLKVWDLESGRELRTLKGHSGWVTSVAVTANGLQAVSGSNDGTLKVWDIESGRELRTLEGRLGGVRSVAVTPDGQRAVCSSGNKTLTVWDLESGRELRRLEGHSGWIRTVAVTANGRLAVSGSDDKMLKVWDLESGRELRTLEGHSGWVTSVAITPDGRLAVSGSEDRTLKVWDLESGRAMRILEGHSGGVRSVAVTPDGRWVVSGSLDETLTMWDIESGREIRTPEGHSGGVRSVAVTPDGRWAVSGSLDETLIMWEFESGREMRTLKGHSGWTTSVAVTANGRLAVSGSDDRTLKVWDLESGRELRMLEGHSDWIRTVAVTANGRLAVSGSIDRMLTLWDLESGREMRTLKGHSGVVRSVAITPDGLWAVSGSDDRTLKVWDLKSGCELHTLEGHSDGVRSVAMTPDRRWAVSGSDDRTLRVWDLESGREMRTLKGHSGVVRSVAVTANGRLAVTGSADRTLKVWDLESGMVIALFTADAPVECCSVTPEGQGIIAGDRLGRVHFLRLEGADPHPEP